MELCAFALVNRLINVKNGAILQKTTQVKNFFRTAHGQFAALTKYTRQTLSSLGANAEIFAKNFGKFVAILPFAQIVWRWFLFALPFVLFGSICRQSELLLQAQRANGKPLKNCRFFGLVS